MKEITLKYNDCKGQKPTQKICNPASAYKVLLNEFDKDTIGINEQFIVLLIDQANQVIGSYKPFKGGICSVVVDIRLILCVALKSLEVRIIVAHNHPSGNIQPSSEDRELTQRLNKACNLLDISLADHIIISPFGDWLSFANEGML